MVIIIITCSSATYSIYVISVKVYDYKSVKIVYDWKIHRRRVTSSEYRRQKRIRG